MITFSVPKNSWCQSDLNKYKWYHCMKFDNNTETNGWKSNDGLCDWLVAQTKTFNVRDKIVADIGCRDGLLSFVMEQMGAIEIFGIDNDISIGARDLLIPKTQSKIQMFENNLYDLDYSKKFDVTVCCGVLYHLRFPFLGLKKLVDITKDGGTIHIEGGFMVNKELENYSLCGCTSFTNSPYEDSSPIFFNTKGLIDTMFTFGCKYVSHVPYNNPHVSDKSNLIVDRIMFTFEKTNVYDEGLNQWLMEHTFPYWYGIHKDHTVSGAP
jgi:SAM-dependent methyltransferase